MTISRSQMKKQLIGNQKRLDMNKNNMIDRGDLKMLRGNKMSKGGTVMKSKGGAVKMSKGGAVKMSKGGAVKMAKGGAIKKMSKGGAVKMAKGGAIKKMNMGGRVGGMARRKRTR